jgi:hypothetical protein
MRNPKHEIRNPKQYEDSEFECSKLVLSFCHLIFGFVSSFNIRISDLSWKGQSGHVDHSE